MSLAIGIDLGGTNIYAVLVDRQGRVLASDERPTPVPEGPAGVLSRMFSMARGLLAAAPGAVLGIGLAIPGLVDRERGLSLNSANLGWRNVAVTGPFRAEFGLPAEMDNDVRAGALGELHFGAGRRFRNFLFAALGTGIGAGIVLDGHLYRGPRGVAGEFGHIPVRPGGARCACGGTGCQETLASGPAVRRRALAARSGDPLALRIWAQVGADLGLGILTYQTLMDPDAIIIGGGVSLAGDLLLEPARRTVAERGLPGIRDHAQIVAAELGDEAAAVGAAALVPGLLSQN